MSEPELPMRQAVRGLLIDHRDRVLLVKLAHTTSDWVGWILPGGGLESGEDLTVALRRELVEETGLDNAFIGPVVCLRRQYGRRIAPGFGGQEEVIHLVPCHDFALEPKLDTEALRSEGIIDLRWFALDEIRASTETMVPEGLADLVHRVLEYGGSVDPLVIEVSEDGQRPLRR